MSCMYIWPSWWGRSRAVATGAGGALEETFDHGAEGGEFVAEFEGGFFENGGGEFAGGRFMVDSGSAGGSCMRRGLAALATVDFAVG